MKKGKKDKNFVHKPTYPGGSAAFRKFIRENLRYPKEALKKKIEGVVRVRYEIDYHGKVVDTKVMTGLGHGCDEEAQRIIRLLKFKVPKQRGVKVLFHKTTNIHFKLSKKSGTVEYKYVSTKESSDGKDSGGYTYSISW